jgi:DNA invertase Pin-like site-specific DNA recombinase
MAGYPGNKLTAIYSRVLVDWQTTENEIAVLKEVAAQRGWKLGEIYVDDALKRANGKDKRPAIEKLFEDAKDAQLGSVMAWSIDQLARSVQGITNFIGRIAALELSQYYHSEGIDTSTPNGRAMVQMCVMLSESRRGLRQNPSASPSGRARGEGTRIGRIKVDPQTEWAICQALATGTKGILKIATEFSVPSSTVQRIKAEMNKLS